MDVKPRCSREKIRKLLALRRHQNHKQLTLAPAWMLSLAEHMRTKEGESEIRVSTQNTEQDSKDTEATVPDTEGKVSSYRDEAEGRATSDTNSHKNKCEPIGRTWRPEGHSEFIVENFPKGNGQE